MITYEKYILISLLLIGISIYLFIPAVFQNTIFKQIYFQPIYDENDKVTTITGDGYVRGEKYDVKSGKICIDLVSKDENTYYKSKIYVLDQGGYFTFDMQVETIDVKPKFTVIDVRTSNIPDLIISVFLFSIGLIIMIYTRKNRERFERMFLLYCKTFYN